MAKSNFKIAYVTRGMEQLWRAYWVTNQHSEEVLAAHRAGELGRVEIIVAARLADAIAQVERLHPDCTVMRQGSGRIGNT